ncbi:flagellar protein [bacterium]|nr:flagellar protein [bacterium]
METKNVGLTQDLLNNGRLGRVQQDRGLNKPQTNEKPGSQPFSDLLEQQIQTSQPKVREGLKFSAHAKSRLESRGINLNAEDMLKLQDAVDRVKAKGSKESLILTDQAAFVVSVKNDTVITAVDRESLKENIFTNIDSTIMI